MRIKRTRAEEPDVGASGLCEPSPAKIRRRLPAPASGKSLKAIIALLLLPCFVVSAATRYVWQDSPSPGPPDDIWLNAAAHIQNAVDSAQAGDTVLAINGVIATGGPIPGLGLSNVVAIAGDHQEDGLFQALRGDGTVVTLWGGAQVWPDLTNAVAIADNMALRSDGALVSYSIWSGYDTNLPSELSNVVSMAAGGYQRLALKKDGTVAAWAERLSDSTNVPAGLSNIVALAVGASASLALRSDGMVMGWGRNTIYDDYHGTTEVTGQATVPAGLRDVVAIAAGRTHSLALRSDGTVVAWGKYFSFIEGPDYWAPVEDANDFADLTALTNVIAIAAGGNNSLALMNDGTVKGWGPPLYAGGNDYSAPPDWQNVVAIAANTDDGGLALAGDGPPFVMVQPVSRSANAGTRTFFHTAATGARPLSYQWQCNSTNLVGATNATLILDDVGITQTGSYRVMVTNGLGVVESAEALLTVIRASPTISHVWQDSPNPAPPFTNWTTAAHTIQDAVDVAQSGDTVLVTNGVYATGGRAVVGTMTNRVVVDKAITVRSVNGPEVTLLEGAAAVLVGGTLGNEAIRCVYLASGAALSGFTLTNGHTRASGDAVVEQAGGGVWCESATATVSNCLLVRDRARYGGGAYRGTLENCILTDNYALQGGGGASTATLNHCILTSNSAYYAGGGAGSCALNYCTLVGNSAWSSDGDGGGASGCTLSHCTLTGNYAGEEGGGVIGSTLDYCILIGNQAPGGGGAEGGVLSHCALVGNSAVDAGGADAATLINCTLASNSATLRGGGTDGCTLFNCIVYDNTAPTGSDHVDSTLYSSCTKALPTSGVGNITNAPLFVNLAEGNLHLQSDSPCINAGNNSYVTNTTTDLDGNPRIVGGTVDIGAYEFQSPASMISYAWLQQYGLPSDGSTDLADSDNDHMNNWQEWIADTDPTNRQSIFRIDAIEPGPPVIIHFPSSSNRLYTLVYSPEPTGSNAFGPTWTNVAGQGDRIGTGGRFSLTDTNSTALRFYRIGVRTP